MLQAKLIECRAFSAFASCRAAIRPGGESQQPLILVRGGYVEALCGQEK